jgi:hypothetical protein
MTQVKTRRPPLGSRLRRIIRSYGIVIAIAIGFILLALMVREKPKTVPAQGLRTPSVSFTVT